MCLILCLILVSFYIKIILYISLDCNQNSKCHSESKIKTLILNINIYLTYMYISYFFRLKNINSQFKKRLYSCLTLNRYYEYDVLVNYVFSLTTRATRDYNFPNNFMRLIMLYVSLVLLTGLSHSLESLFVMNVASSIAISSQNGAETAKESKCS